MKVLITTKSKFFYEALKFILYRDVKKFNLAKSFEEFKEMVKRNEYDLILCDFDCMQDNAEDVIELLRDLSSYTPIIVFSFDTTQSIKRKISKSTLTNLISRPLNPLEVLKAVKRIKES